jgi:hypothetical protein
MREETGIIFLEVLKITTKDFSQDSHFWAEI